MQAGFVVPSPCGAPALRTAAPQPGASHAGPQVRALAKPSVHGPGAWAAAAGVAVGGLGRRRLRTA
eukprot:4120530-Alexandrium_andersonii.AAC.1